MNIVILDTNPLFLEKLKTNVEKLKPTYEVEGFISEKDAKEYLRINSIDIAFLSVEFANVAKKLLKENERTNIIFMNDKDTYTKDILSIRASAYLFKPITNTALENELNDLRYPINEIALRVQCFGNFAVFSSKGDIMRFSRTKAKELFAYLVYKRGSDVSTKEIGAVLFEDEAFDEKQMSYVHQLFFSLTKDLKAVGAEDVLVRKHNATSIDISKVDCDYFRFNNNDEQAKRLYAGEFMMQYEWADYVTAYLDRNVYE